MKKEMNKRRFLPLLALPLLLLAGCSKDGIEDDSLNVPEQNGNITFEIGFAPQTRVSTDAEFECAWEDGDAIGIFAVKHGEPLATAYKHINNVKLTYDSNTWTASETLWWSGSGKLDFYAYYPYNDNGGDPQTLDPTAITFNVKADQSAATDYSKSYLLTAKSDNTIGCVKGQTVTLAFFHALAMVQVTLTAERETNNIGAVGDISVSLRGVKTASTLNLGTQTASATGGGDQIVKMYRAGETDDGEPIFRTLVPAQEVVEGGYAFLLSQFNELYNANGSTSLTAGQAEIHGIGMPFIPTVKIKAGTFQMGSPAKEPNRYGNETQHEVTLTKDFYMSKYEVTNAQYAAFLNAEEIGQNGRYTTGSNSGEDLIYNSSTRYSSSRYNWGVNWDSANGKGKWVPQTGYENHPVIYVTWYGAKAYADWLSQIPGITCSLPTEAQWEYACRGDYPNKSTETSTLPFGIGDGTKLTGEVANIRGQFVYELPDGAKNLGVGYGIYLASTAPVGSYSPNNYGLYDMHGNVWEWCSDWFGEDYYGNSDPSDPSGPPSPSPYTDRVLRGDGWLGQGQYCRSAYRNHADPDNNDYYYGFRVVFNITP